jgi:hypothetical protein
MLTWSSPEDHVPIKVTLSFGVLPFVAGEDNALMVTALSHEQ